MMSADVFSAVGSAVVLDRASIAFLKKRASSSLRRRARLCAHEKPTDSVHEMIIALRKGAYIAPHKHRNKAESFHVLEGRLDVVVFNDEGKIQDVVQMGDYASGLPFFYRRRDGAIHTVVVRSPFVIFHETTNGPFVKLRSTIPAPWAADESNPRNVRAFQWKTDAAVITFLAARSRSRRRRKSAARTPDSNDFLRKSRIVRRARTANVSRPLRNV